MSEQHPEEEYGTPPAPEAQRPIVVRVEDRLRTENAQLRHMNAVRDLQLHRVQQDVLLAREQEAMKGYIDALNHLKDEYGFDPAMHEMDANTGLVRPLSPKGPPDGMPTRRA